MQTARDLIARLNLLRHPEGGWFRETYRAAELAPGPALPERFGGSRAFSTAIYFLLEKGDISALHRIKSDEIWHFYAGTPVLVHVISQDGSYRALKLGPDPESGDSFQIVVPAGSWFGAEVTEGDYSLVGCTVAPGFDFADFELADGRLLAEIYPMHSEIIRRLARR